MGQASGKQRKKGGKSGEAAAPRGKYADYLVYWEGESDQWMSPLPPEDVIAPSHVPAATSSSGGQFLALLNKKDLSGLIAARLDTSSRLALRLTCRAAALRVEAMKEGVLDLRFFPVLLQGLKLALCRVPWPVTELYVDQMVVRVPGGLEGLEKVLTAHSETIVRLEVYAGPRWSSSLVG